MAMMAMMSTVKIQWSVSLTRLVLLMMLGLRMLRTFEMKIHHFDIVGGCHA